MCRYMYTSGLKNLTFPKQRFGKWQRAFYPVELSRFAVEKSYVIYGQPQVYDHCLEISHVCLRISFFLLFVLTPGFAWVVCLVTFSKSSESQIGTKEPHWSFLDVNVKQPITECQNELVLRFSKKDVCDWGWNFYGMEVFGHLHKLIITGTVALKFFIWVKSATFCGIFLNKNILAYFHGILLDLLMFCLNCVPSAIEGMIKNASPTRQCASFDLNLDTRFLRTPVPRSAEPDEQGVYATLLYLHNAW